jgi:site-specific DNA-cytosine methylase
MSYQEMVADTNHLSSHTAFGASEPVPCDADIMIAGSSCIDYSSLNTKPKEFGNLGESYETLVAAVEYAKEHRPNIVILENVYKFPWASTEGLWHDAGYATKVVYLDSKDFYLPQTRQRGYMIGLRRDVISERNVDLDADTAVENWFKTLGKLQRRASSPFTDFIFSNDDAALRKFNRQTAMQMMPGKTVPWEKCRVECLSYRLCNLLGFKKPVTAWENNGSCTVPDFCNSLWFKRQVERIWDTIEINHLRSAALRWYDIAYKR